MQTRGAHKIIKRRIGSARTLAFSNTARSTCVSLGLSAINNTVMDGVGI
jgi:hypothetical protein